MRGETLPPDLYAERKPSIGTAVGTRVVQLGSSPLLWSPIATPTNTESIHFIRFARVLFSGLDLLVRELISLAKSTRTDNSTLLRGKFAL